MINTTGNAGAILSDVDELRGRVAELEKKEAIFRAGFELCPVALTISRAADGRYIEVNQAFAAMTGVLRDEVVGRTLVEIGIDVDAAGRARLLDDLREKGHAEAVPVEIRRRDGQVRHLVCSARKWQSDGQDLVSAAFEDVTDRTNARLALEAEAAPRRELLE
jgi:PAS domain S-box-containing protein